MDARTCFNSLFRIVLRDTVSGCLSILRASADAPQDGRGGRPVRKPAVSGATLSAAMAGIFTPVWASFFGRGPADHDRKPTMIHLVSEPRTRTVTGGRNPMIASRPAALAEKTVALGCRSVIAFNSSGEA